MESQLFSISKIFTERLLRIPDYQRGYAWKDKQLKDFWADLIQLELEKNHYVGVLTLEEVPKNTIQKWTEDHWIIRSKNYNPYYVVDGQQRLTTTIILIQSITELMELNQKLNYTSLEEIRKKFIYDSKDDGISRSYIFGYEKDNPSYEFLKTRIFLEKSDTCSSSIQETIYTRNLENARIFFLGRLKTIDISEIENIYRKVTQSLLFNIYTISNDIDVYVAFETMNNRGKPLSHLELLKNRLIYLSTKFNEEETERNQLRHTINEAWKSIYHYLGKNKDKPLEDDVFLRNHFIVYYGNTLNEKRDGKASLRYMMAYRFRDFYEEYLLETVFTTRNILVPSDENIKSESLSVVDVYNYVKSLKNSVEIWFQLLNPKDSEFEDEVKTWLEKLNRLDILQYAPLIMVFFQTTRSTILRTKFLKVLERYAFFMYLIRTRSASFYFVGSDNIDFTAMSLQLTDKSITPESVIKKIDQSVDTLKNNPDLLKHIRLEFRKKGFYDWTGIKYFLYEYELSLKERTKTYRDKIKWDEYVEDKRDFHTVEHVYPQRPRKECWIEKFEKYADKERTALRHSLGNLVPLSQPKNSSFQNKCFADKKSGEESCIGFSYGSYSENEIAQYNEWTAKEIMERGLKLISFMEKRWEIRRFPEIKPPNIRSNQDIPLG